MLRCPKCGRLYEDGTQRFCTFDGVRLLAVENSLSLPQKERISKANSSRQTSRGELLTRLYIAPPGGEIPPSAEPETSPTSFQDFGLHSSKPANLPHETETGDDFYSFKSLREENNKSLREEKSLASQNEKKPVRVTTETLVSDSVAEMPREYIDYEPEIANKKRKTDAPFIIVCLLGGILFLSAIGAAIYFFRQHENSRQAAEDLAIVTAPQSLNTTPSREISRTPDGFIAFQNSKESLDSKLAEKFVGFSLAYPNNWQKNSNSVKEGNFLDVSNRVSNGLPIENLLVSWYESRGTYQADGEIFPILIKQLAIDYAKEIPSFQQVSEGATKINGFDAYEIRFRGEAADKAGKPVKIWGRAIFLPVGNAEAKSGLTMTMLATSLAPALTGAEDVGNKGELARILETLRIEN